MSSAGSSSGSTQRADGGERTCKDRRFPEPGVPAVLRDLLFAVVSCPGREGLGPTPPHPRHGEQEVPAGLRSRAYPDSGLLWTGMGLEGLWELS